MKKLLLIIFMLLLTSCVTKIEEEYSFPNDDSGYPDIQFAEINGTVKKIVDKNDFFIYDSVDINIVVEKKDDATVTIGLPGYKSNLNWYIDNTYKVVNFERLTARQTGPRDDDESSDKVHRFTIEAESGDKIRFKLTNKIEDSIGFNEKSSVINLYVNIK